MGIGNLGISELLVIFVIVLVFFGPRRMPEIARSLGSAMREFRRSLNQIQREFEEADPRSALRPDRSVLDRMPESVRPRPPQAPGREETREGAAPGGEDAPSPGDGLADAAPDTGSAPTAASDGSPEPGPSSPAGEVEAEPRPSASPATDGDSGSG